MCTYPLMTHIKPSEDKNTLIRTVLWVTFSILVVFPDYNTTTPTFRVRNIHATLKVSREIGDRIQYGWVKQLYVRKLDSRREIRITETFSPRDL
jgi:hypothetical protein